MQAKIRGPHPSSQQQPQQQHPSRQPKKDDEVKCGMNHFENDAILELTTTIIKASAYKPILISY